MPLFFMDDDGVAIPTNRDARMYNVFAANQDFIIQDALDEFEITYSASSFVITLGTGEGLLCGRHITNTTAATLALSENDSGYIVLRADMSQAIGNRLSLVAVNSTYDEDINEDGGTYRDLILGQYTTDANGVSSYTDLRKIKASASEELKTMTPSIKGGAKLGHTLKIDNEVLDAIIPSVDPNNLIMTMNINNAVEHSWTATEDCFLVSFFVTNSDTQNSYYYYINGINVAKYGTLTAHAYDINFARQGDVIRAKYNAHKYNGSYIKAYGIRY